MDRVGQDGRGVCSFTASTASWIASLTAWPGHEDADQRAGTAIHHDRDVPLRLGDLSPWRVAARSLVSSSALMPALPRLLQQQPD